MVRALLPPDEIGASETSVTWKGTRATNTIPEETTFIPGIGTNAINAIISNPVATTTRGQAVDGIRLRLGSASSYALGVVVDFIKIG